MPEGHDCNKCDHTEICPLYPIAGWLNEHEKEVKACFDDEAGNMSKICETYALKNPLMLLNEEAFLVHLLAAFTLGYYRGSTQTKVPEVFEKP